MMTFEDRPRGAPPGAPLIDPRAPAAAPAAAPASVVDLLEAHGAEIYRHLRRLSATAEDAADLHQETFLRAHRAWRRLPPDANHRAWLHRVAANVAIDAHRRREARGAADSLDGHAWGHPGRPTAAEPAAGAQADPGARAGASELRDTVRAALGSLPARERTAVTARVLDGAAYPEVAAMLDCTDENARQVVSRGLRRLRAALAPYLETDR